MKRTNLTGILGLVLAATLGCGDGVPPTQAVYLLVDTSGTYTTEIDKVQSIMNYLLGTLNSDDSLGMARIDSGSFTEKDIVAKVTFDRRPSYSNQQKRAFRREVDRFVTGVKSSPYTDISGGLLQAAEWLHETGAGHQYILIFSDLEEDLRDGYVRDFTIDLAGIQVVALNVTKLRSDQIDPREYMDRLESWKGKVEDGGGAWRVINDLDRVDGLIRH
jgi:hypothetical protein